MSDLASLLDGAPRIVTAGIDVLADALEQQNADVHRVAWKPPLPGTADALATLAGSPAAIEILPLQ